MPTLPTEIIENYYLILTIIIIFLTYLRYRTNRGVYQMIASVLVFHMAFEFTGDIMVVLALSILGFFFIYEAVRT